MVEAALMDLGFGSDALHPHGVVARACISVRLVMVSRSRVSECLVIVCLKLVD